MKIMWGNVILYLILPFIAVSSLFLWIQASYPFSAKKEKIVEPKTEIQNNFRTAKVEIAEVEKDHCTGEEKEDLLYAKGINFSEQDILADSNRVWISPDDTTMLFPKYGFCIQDLFVKNQDTLTGYYVHPRLISVVEVVLEICQEYESRTGRAAQIRINSVVRSVPYNKRIGGVSNSEHLEPLGHAVDIRFAYGKNSTHYNWHFKTLISLRNKNMDKLLAAGARSFGFYPWGIHFGVRDRPNARHFHKGIGYAVWGKSRKS